MLGWLGYEGSQFVQVVEFMDLLSTLFRHASSTLKSSADVLSKVIVFRPCNGTQSDILQESAPLAGESNEIPGVEQIIVSSIGEGMKVVSQWKIDNAPISVDVPSTMSLKEAEEVKRQFELAGADHLLKGPTINAILEKKQFLKIRSLRMQQNKLITLYGHLFLHLHQVCNLAKCALLNS